MTELAGYTLTETLREDGEFVLCRGRNDADLSPVLVLAPVLERPAPGSLERLEHEYALRDELDSAWAARPLRLARQAGRKMLVLEDPGGGPLERLLGRPMEAMSFLRLAIAISDALAKLHAHGLIHKDLKPAHILVDAERNEVRLTGFGLASRLPSEQRTVEPPEVIAGTLAYMAPEQTGRMNRSVDSRSDLYSLGVIFYEMLTGRLPFEAEDALEWVHCHIARMPRPPAQVVEAIPQTVSGIVMKLLAKEADDRYQSAHGLRHDLEQCLAQLQSGGRIMTFALGARDVSDRLLIPQTLYGREAEISALLTAFERVAGSGTPELVFLSGYSGIGKSALAQELRRPIVRRRGYFAAGKFDQYQRNIPYIALSKAFHELIRQLLAESEERIVLWRGRLQEALGAEGQLIIEVIPQLERVLGLQPGVPVLPPTEAQNRFHRVFQRFVGAFAQPEQPLVLFLDDLQWVDAGSLKLIEYLITHPETRYLMVIGAYRDNEVAPSHPLLLAADRIAGAGVAIRNITLGPLSGEHLGELIADTLHCELPRAAPLARLVFEKTRGNPFFFIQFLTMLHREGLLVFDAQNQAWTWDMAGIEAKGFTDNVAELMAGRLKGLPKEAREVVQLAGSLGHAFELDTLAMIGERSAVETESDLLETIRKGLIQCRDGSCRFLHDRVQEAALSLIPEAERPVVHLRIGRLLLAHTAPEEVDERVFDLVTQLNLGASLISEKEERTRLAQLNLLAARKAKASAAFQAASGYLAAGSAMLGEEAWEEQYGLTYALTLERAECAYLSGALGEAEGLFPVLLHHARTRIDRAGAYRVKIDTHNIKGEGDKAIESAIECLRMLGIDTAAHPSAKEVQRAYEAVWSNLGNRRIEELINLPRMTDPEMQAAMEILARLYIPAYYSDNNLFCLHLCQAVNLSLQHGNSAASTYAYGWFGVILISVFHRARDGYRFARMAYDLMERHQFLAYKANAHMQMKIVTYWTQPLDEMKEHTRAAFEAALETGDVPVACFSCSEKVIGMLARGDPLSGVERAAQQGLDFVRRAGFSDVVQLIVGTERFVRAMRGGTRALSSYDDAGFSEAEFESSLDADRMPSLVFYYQVMKLMARFLSGDFEAALAAGERSKALLWAGLFSVQSHWFTFYHALTLAAVFRRLSAEKQAEALGTLLAHQRQLQEWAENYPPTFHHPYALVSAELARIRGGNEEAMRLYEQAIGSARDHGFVQNEALANELAGRFYLDRGFETIAYAYLRNARYAYLRWEALGKVKDLDQRYPRLAEPEPLLSPTATIGAPVEQLDVVTVVKASQALSGEIVLGRLIGTLMTIAVEHAGAERGILILPRGEEYRIVAEAATGREKVDVNIRQAQVTPTAFPESILRYVLRTRESVILDDASAPNLFSNDEYVRRTRPRSVLCLPLVKQAKLAGVLYLENNLTPRVFTSGRVAVLELIASQAAISLENATLYTDLKREIAERRRAEEAVSESQRLLQSIIDNSTAVIYVKDLQGRYLLVNRRFEELFHIGRDAVAGRTDYDLFPKERADSYRVFDQQVVKAGNSLAAEEEIPHDDGIHTYISVKAPLRDEEGNPYAVCCISTDITERKQIDRMKDEFISTAAHELRTPLTTVMGYLELLLQHEDAFAPEERKEFLELVYRNSEALARLINDLLDLSTVQAGRLITLRKSREDLAALVGRVVTAWQGLTDRHQFSFEFADAPVDLCLDAGKIGQVLENLLSNAVKFSPAGGRIRVSGRRRDGELEVTVTDEGIGMRPEQVARVFDKFYRADASDTAVGGLGLGMSIVKNIVEAHGGRIWVDSEPGRGTRVHFTLPLEDRASECALPLH